MRLRTYMLAALLASASSAALAQQPAHHGVRKASSREAAPPPTGAIEGHVVGSEEDPRSWTIVIEGGSAKRLIPTDERGRFSVRVAPGVYKAYVKLMPGEGDERAQYSTYYVAPGGVTNIQIDPAYEHFYCTDAGEKVIPARASHGEGENRRGLSRPRYDFIEVSPAPNVTTKVAVQYCGRVPVGKAIHYKSPTFMFGDAWLTFETARVTRPGYVVEGVEGTLYRHGAAAQSEQFVVARFEGGRPYVNLTGRAAFSAKGVGEIDSGAAIFEIKADDRGVKKIEYTDLTTGLRLSSIKEGCILITESAKDGLTIAGSASVTKPGAARPEIHEFRVTLQDRGSERKKQDEFSISIPGLMDYQKGGPVTSGDINVSGNLRKPGRQGARTTTSLSSSRLNVQPARMKRP